MAKPVSRVIPREELSEFQRWQFNSLLEGMAPHQAESTIEAAVSSPDVDEDPVEQDFDASADAEESPIPEALPFPTAEEIAAIEQQAREEGYQSGLLAGRAAAENEVSRLRALLSGLSEACQAAESQLADDVLDLALVVARQLVRENLKVDRSLLLSAVREAIAGLPPVREPARLVLNPEDLKAVSALLAGELPSEYWRLIPDAALPSGSCRIESTTSSVDLGLAARWQTILAVLGKAQRADLAWGYGTRAEPSDDDDTA